MEINLTDFKKKWAFLKDYKIFIACSGGLDSVVLTQLMTLISDNCTLLHVNYHLRGEESNQDEKFVRNLGNSLKIPVKINSVQAVEMINLSKGNVQVFARDFRYNWFKNFLNDENSVLLLGHHLDDQIETFYMNLARKSGIFGLACMLEKNRNIFRPLLEFEKDDLKQFALKNNYKWVEDSSNSTNKYTRNRLRNEFLPKLFQEIPDLKKSITLLITLFQQEVKELNNSVKNKLSLIQKNQRLDFEDYRALSIEQKILIFKYFGFKARQLDEIDKLLKSNRGKFLDSKTHKITHEVDFFSIVNLRDCVQIPKLKIEPCPELPKIFNKNELYLDKDKLKGELKIRVWGKGDRIKSIGIKGSQSVSDIIKDAKIPNYEKNKVFVVYDEKNIHWCIGLKIANLALASKNTKEILKLILK
jgi:tRNA(Ile)-lysidine synthase